ncbi:hypothetical protein MKW92_017400 [Papaver armeniacum]|nr:hypothetical protein MKW92_017400 [Papaver armeniacum]
MSTRCVLRNLSYSKARFLSTFTTTSSSSTATTPVPLLFATTKVLGCQGAYLCGFRAFHGAKIIHQENSSAVEGQLDPYSVVADDLLNVASRLRSIVAAEVPKLASAAEYFFNIGAEGKKFRPTIILLMASALNMSTLAPDGGVDSSYNELHSRQLSIAVITEMIYAVSLVHCDVLDDAETRRGIGSSNCFMGNKDGLQHIDRPDKNLSRKIVVTFCSLASLNAGDVLLARAYVGLASLGNSEVVALVSRSVQHLVTDEAMQMTASSQQRSSMEYYMKKTYNKTAALISNSCQAVSIITGQTAEVSRLAYDYGWKMGVAFQLINDVLDFTGTSGIMAPILFTMEEFPQLRKIVERGFHDPADVDLAAEILGKSNGIQRTIDLASKHANLAAAAILSLPETDNVDVGRSRQALVDLTRLVITRKG